MMKKLLNILIILLVSWAAMAQENVAVLKGIVIDAADGYPLIGVSVLVEGTKYGTVTDVDGAYELRIPQQKCEVVFSYVGYDDVLKLYNLKNAASFGRVVMEMNAEQLADVGSGSRNHVFSSRNTFFRSCPHAPSMSSPISRRRVAEIWRFSSTDKKACTWLSVTP